MLPTLDVVESGKELLRILTLDGRLLEPLNMEPRRQVSNQLFSLRYALLNDLQSMFTREKEVAYEDKDGTCPLFCVQLSLLAHQVDMAGACSSDRLLCIVEAVLLTPTFLLLLENVIIVRSNTFGKLIVGS